MQRDSLLNKEANDLKSYVIRFDVANGNVYLPVKKRIKANNEKGYFKKYVFTKTDGKDGTRSYMIAGRYFKPRVGNFIRLIFEQVPKNIDVDVTAEFIDKNLENASAFQSFLNKSLQSVDSNTTVKSYTPVPTDSTAIKIIDSTKRERSQKVSQLNAEIAGGKQELEITIKDLGAVINDMIPKVKGNQAGKEKEILNRMKTANEALMPRQTDSSSMNIAIEKIKNLSELSVLIEELETISKADRKELDDLNRQVKRLQAILANTEKLRVEIGRMEAVITSLETQKLELQAAHDTKIKAIYDSLNARRTIVVQPFQVSNNDLTLLNIIYTNTDSKKQVSRDIVLKNRAGFKLDFSTGFIGTGLRDENYRLIPAPGAGNDSSVLINDDKGRFAIGFGLLAHAYVRSGERINVAINTGIMLNGSNQTVNYIAGLSVPLGLEQRFIISGGAAFGKIKRLTAGYATGVSYPSSILNLSAGVPYTEKWSSSWYIGVSYNLSAALGNSRKVVVAGPQR